MHELARDLASAVYGTLKAHDIPKEHWTNILVGLVHAHGYNHGCVLAKEVSDFYSCRLLELDAQEPDPIDITKL